MTQSRRTVGREPTEAMVAAGRAAGGDPSAIWLAMYDAAPGLPAVQADAAAPTGAGRGDQAPGPLGGGTLDSLAETIRSRPGEGASGTTARRPADTHDTFGTVDEAGAAERFEALHAEVVAFVRTEAHCTTAAIQRRFQIGFNKASRLVERMEAEGVVGPWDDSGRRKVLG